MHLAMTLTKALYNVLHHAARGIQGIKRIIIFIILWWRTYEIHYNSETSIDGDSTLLVYRPYHVLCPLQERDDGGDLVLHRQQTTTLDLNRLQLELGGSHVFTTGSQVRPKSLDFLRIKNIQKGFFNSKFQDETKFLPNAIFILYLDTYNIYVQVFIMQLNYTYNTSTDALLYVIANDDSCQEF